MLLLDEIAERLYEAKDAYEAGHPIMSDTEFDLLEAELRSLDPAHPLLYEVGSKKLSTGWEKISHTTCPITMGSQNKALSRGELKDFMENHPDSCYLASLKGDGMSIRLQYKGGQLVSAVTRGDGEFGEDITANVRKMQRVPLTLSEPIDAHVRGEIILTRSAFSQALSEGLAVKTPRNAGVGFAKDSQGDNAHRLTVFCYELYIEGAEAFNTCEAEFRYMESLSFKCIPWEVITSYESYINTFWSKWVTSEDRALTTDIPADGVVLRCNSLASKESFGYSANGLNPAYSVAHKFAPPIVECEVLGVLWDPGPTGVITPVLQVDAQLDDIHLRNVSGHNLKKLLDMGVKIGSTIIVERAGMVIPYLVGVKK